MHCVFYCVSVKKCTSEVTQNIYLILSGLASLGKGGKKVTLEGSLTSYSKGGCLLKPLKAVEFEAKPGQLEMAVSLEPLDRF